MSDSSKPGAIAVDGGGTHCRIALIKDNSIDTVVSDPANVSSDFSGSVNAIVSGLIELSQRNSVSMDQLKDTSAYLGLAGVIDQQIAQQLLQALPFSRATVQDDRPSALRGALGTADGVLAHCGTGSFFAAQYDKQQRLTGGWGGVLDDVASARWAGARALSLTLYSVDGTQPQTELTRSLLHEYSGATGIVSFASGATATELGQVAKTVTAYARKNDVVAHQVLSDGAEIIAASLAGIGWTDGDTICLTGGLGPWYKSYLPPDMQCCVKEPLAEPLDGAIDLARELYLETK